MHTYKALQRLQTTTNSVIVVLHVCFMLFHFLLLQGVVNILYTSNKLTGQVNCSHQHGERKVNNGEIHTYMYAKGTKATLSGQDGFENTACGAFVFLHTLSSFPLECIVGKWTHSALVGLTLALTVCTCVYTPSKLTGQVNGSHQHSENNGEMHTCRGIQRLHSVDKMALRTLPVCLLYFCILLIASHWSVQWENGVLCFGLV